MLLNILLGCLQVQSSCVPLKWDTYWKYWQTLNRVALGTAWEYKWSSSLLYWGAFPSSHYLMFHWRWFGLLLGKGRIRHTMFPLLQFARYKAYGHIFFPCLPSNGGSPWYPSNHIWTPGCCSFCYLYHRCGRPSQGFAASIPGPLTWTLLALRTPDNVTHAPMLKAALTSLLNSLLCNHICGISNPNLNCWAGVLCHPSCDSPLLLPHRQLSDTTSRPSHHPL